MIDERIATMKQACRRRGTKWAASKKPKPPIGSFGDAGAVFPQAMGKNDEGE
jgi:hypothetical protein